MMTQLKSMTLAVLLGLGSQTVLAAEPPAEAQAPAAAPDAKVEAPQDGPKSFSMTIGADGAKVTKGDGETHGIKITVDDGDDREARVELAGKVVDRVVDDLEKSLADLPEDVRRDLDADDMRELRKALREIRDLKKDRAEVRVDEGFDEDILPGIVAIVLLFGGPVVIVALVTYNRRRNRQMVLDSIDRMVAQGREVPAELIDALDTGDRPRGSRTMLSRGVTNVALGLGIAGVLWGLGGEEAASLGLIWICYGAGQLLVWKLEGGNKPAQDVTPLS